MGFGIRIAPGVRLSASSRGLRMGIGPRIARVHVGSGRTGFSTGAGPFSYYTSLGGQRGRRSGRTSGFSGGAAAARQQVASAQRALREQAAEHAHTAVAAAERRLVTLHLDSFPPTVPPPDDGPAPVDRAQLLAELERREIAGVRRFDRVAKYDAKQRAAAALPAAVAWEEQRRWTEHQARRQADWAAYQRLAANEPDAVLGALEAAFADNESPAVPVDCEAGRVSVVVLFDGVGEVPEKRADRTPTGQPRLVKRTKGERNDLYVRWLASTVLATVKEAFAVAPGVAEVAVVVVRRDPTALDPQTAVAAVYAGTFSRYVLANWHWPTVDPVEQILLAPGALLNRRGQVREVVPLDLRSEPELRDVVDVVRRALQGGRQGVDAHEVRSALATPPTPPPPPFVPPPPPPSARREPERRAPTPGNSSASVVLVRGANAPVPTERLTVSITADALVDLSAVLLDTEHRAVDDEAIVFYNQPALLDRAVTYSADAGARSQQITVDLAGLPAAVHRVALAAAVDPADDRRLSELPTIESVVADEGRALVRYQVDGLTTERAVVLLELYRHREGWKVRAVGQGYDDGLAAMARDLGISVDD